MPDTWYVQGNNGVSVYDLGSTATAAGTATITGTITIPAGALIVILTSEVTATTTGSLSDTVNGAYSSGPSGVMSASAGFGKIWYFANSAALTSVTITYTKSASTNAASWSVFYVTGIATSSPLDTAVTATSNTASASPTVTGGTPTQANNLVVGACAYTNAAAQTVTLPGSQSFITPFQNNNTQPTASCGGGVICLDGPLAKTFNPTLSASCGNVTMICAFKPASSTMIGWWNMTRWTASANKVCGDLVRQNATPLTNAERVFVCYNSTGGTGQTGATEPAWISGTPITRGALTTDNTVRWQEQTGVAALNGDLTNTPTWTQYRAANTNAGLGQVIKSGDGTKLLTCIAGGVMLGSEPTWAAYTTTGATTADSSATWVTLKTLPSGTYGAWAAPAARVNAIPSPGASPMIWIADNHMEVYTSTNTGTPWVTIGTLATPGFVACADHTVAPPPTALTTGAVIKTTGSAGSFIINNAGGFYEANGIDFQCGSASANTTVSMGSTGWTRLTNCLIRQLLTTPPGSTNSMAQGAIAVELVNTQIQFGNALTQIRLFNRVVWKNMPAAFPGTATNNMTHVSGYTSAVLDGVDLSMFGAGKNLFATLSSTYSYNVMLKNCVIGSGVSVASPAPSAPAQFVDVVTSDSGATNYRQERYAYAATKTTETTIVRTGGASDGTTPITWKIATTANVRWLLPYEEVPIAQWIDTTGVAKTVTVYGTINSASLPKNDEIWMEVSYKGSSSNPLASFVTSGKANFLATGTNLTADGSTWGGGGSGAGWSPFRMSVSLTPQMKGYIYVNLRAAKASTTYYVDPLVVVT